MLSPASTIPLSVPHLAGNEWAYVKECLDTNWVSYVGPFVNRFEQQLAAVTGARHAVATNSGTAALHVALLLAGVGPQDEVVMPGLTFVAPANAVRYCGAWPLFTDIRSDDWQWDIGRVAELLATARREPDGRLVNPASGRRIAALMPVHLLGGLCDVDAVAGLAVRYGLPVVEDAAECLGATWKGRPIGAPIPGGGPALRIVTTSFNGNKIITTGGGGALLTDDPALAARARHLTTTAKADALEFYHDVVGFNYRLTNVAAALGVAQLEQLAPFVERKRAHAARYAELLGDLPLVLHPECREGRGTYWMYTVSGLRDRPALLKHLNGAGIMCRPLWQPLHRLPAFSGCAAPAGLAVTESLYAQAVSLPCSVGLTSEEQARVAGELRAALFG